MAMRGRERRSRLRSGLVHLLVWLVVAAPPLSLFGRPAFAEGVATGSSLANPTALGLPAGPFALVPDLAGTGSASALPLLYSRPVDSPDSNPWAPRKWLPLALLIGITLGISLGIDSPDSARWSADNDFDDSARSSLRASSQDGRQTADSLSTAFLAVNAGLLVGDWYLERSVHSPLDSFRIDTSWVFGSQLAKAEHRHAADVRVLSRARERHGHPQGLGVQSAQVDEDPGRCPAHVGVVAREGLDDRG